MGDALMAGAGGGLQVAVASAKSSPGVTTLGWAMGLLWPAPVMVGELDPAGGDLTARLPVSQVRGLAALADSVEGSVGWEQVAECALPVTAACSVLLGSPDGRVSRRAVGLLAAGLPTVSRAAGVAGLWDLGRLDAASPAWAAAEACDTVIVVVYPSAADVAHSVVLIGELQARGCTVGVVVAGPRRRRGAYGQRQVVDAIDGRSAGPVLAFGGVEYDPLGVAMLERIMPYWAGRCDLGRSVKSVVAAVCRLRPAGAAPEAAVEVAVPAAAEHAAANGTAAQ